MAATTSRRWAEGHMTACGESDLAPDGRHGPYFVFDVDEQTWVAGPFRWRWRASLWARRNPGKGGPT